MSSFAVNLFISVLMNSYQLISNERRQKKYESESCRLTLKIFFGFNRQLRYDMAQGYILCKLLWSWVYYCLNKRYRVRMKNGKWKREKRKKYIRKTGLNVIKIDCEDTDNEYSKK